MARGLHQCVWATCRRQTHDTRHHMTICRRRRWQHARSAAASAGREQMMLSTICQRLRCCKGVKQVMANAFATRTAMQREHVEQPEHGENDADEQRLTPCLAISGAQRVEKSGISNLFIEFFCISNPCPGLSFSSENVHRSVCTTPRPRGANVLVGAVGDWCNRGVCTACKRAGPTSFPNQEGRG